MTSIPSQRRTSLSPPIAKRAFLLVAAALCLALPEATAADRYVRANPSGAANGTDWNNAWSISGINWSSIQPGDTIWLAGGTYPSLAVGKSGTSANRISIKRVTAADSAPKAAAGWNSGFDSLVTLAAVDIVEKSYVTLDGNSPYGLRIVVNNGGIGIKVASTASFSCNSIQLINLDLIGPGFRAATAEVYGIRASEGGNPPVLNLLISRCRLQDMDSMIKASAWNGCIIEYTSFINCSSSNLSALHPDTIYFYPCTNVKVRYCRFENVDSESIFFDYGGSTQIYFYGNVMIQGTGSSCSAIETKAGYTMGSIFLYNNVFVGWSKGVLYAAPVASGSVTRNNIFWNCTNSTNGSSSDYNAYNNWNYNGFSFPSEAHSLFSIADPFVSMANNDFHLKATAVLRNAGAALAADGFVDRDSDGNARGADGGWDIGAFEYAASAVADYYVSTTGNDGNPGTQAAPWRTIAKAADTMVAGDSVTVNAGIYNEKIATARSGAAGNRITFRASGTVVTKTFNVSHDHITIDGFEMTNAMDGYMMTWTGNYGELLNNTIHDTGASSGVVKGDGNHFTVRGNRYYSSTGPGDDLTVFIIEGDDSLAERNEIGPGKDNDAFRAWGTNNIIRGNYIHDLTLSSGSSAHLDVIQTFGGGSHNIVFEKNLIDNAHGGHLQMFMTENNGATNTGDWDIRDNIFIGCAGQANLGIPNLRFCNNTVYNSGAGNNLIMFLYDAPGKSDFTGAQIKNNLFVVPTGISTYSQVMSVGSTGSNVQISNNHITRIGTWGTVSGFTDANGINGGDPRFVDAANNDLHVQSTSPAIDKGTTLSGFSYDYDGTARPQGAAWDIGAFERIAGNAAPSITSQPMNVTVTAGQTATFSATATGNPIPTYQWQKNGVAIVGATTATYTTPTTAITDNGAAFRLVASSSGGIATSSAAILTVTAASQAPVVSAASASPATVSGTTTRLSATATDDGGESALTYTWSLTSGPAAVTFIPNGSNTAKVSTATFIKAGIYTVTVSAKDAGTLSGTKSVAVTVNATPTALSISPTGASVQPGMTVDFNGMVSDQFNAALTTQSALTWTISGGGTIAANGLFTADTGTPSPTGGVSSTTYVVTATAGSISSTALVTVSTASTASAGSGGGKQCGGGSALALIGGLGLMFVRRRRR